VQASYSSRVCSHRE